MTGHCHVKSLGLVLSKKITTAQLAKHRCAKKKFPIFYLTINKFILKAVMVKLFTISFPQSGYLHWWNIKHDLNTSEWSSVSVKNRMWKVVWFESLHINTLKNYAIIYFARNGVSMKTTISVVQQQNWNLSCLFRLFHVNKFTDRVTSTVWVGFRGRLRTISKINGIAVFCTEYVCSELIRNDQQSRRRHSLLMFSRTQFWVRIT